MKIGESIVITRKAQEVSPLVVFDILKKNKTYVLKISEDKWVKLKLVSNSKPYLIFVPLKATLSSL